MRPTATQLAVALLLSCAVLWHAPEARAQAGDDDAPGTVQLTEVAEDLYDRGVQHFELGQWDEAAVLFEEAYRYDPTPRLAYNTGRAWHRAGNLVVARVWYERAMGSDDEELLARIAEALALLDAAESDLADETITGAGLDGGEPDDDAHGGRTDRPQAQVARDRPPPAPGRTRRIVGASIAGAGVVAVIVGAATGSTAHARHDDAQRTSDPDRFDALVDRGRSARSVSVATWTTGLVVSAAGAALVAIPSRSGAAIEVGASGTTARVGVRF